LVLSTGEERGTGKVSSPKPLTEESGPQENKLKGNGRWPTKNRSLSLPYGDQTERKGNDHKGPGQNQTVWNYGARKKKTALGMED